MAIQISLHQGNEALSLLKNEKFLNEWQALAQSDPKDTHLQEAPFVNTWYQVYGSIFHPLILVGSHKSGETVGLMFLAQHHKSGQLIHAGNEQAEYHGWISRSKDNQPFLMACLAALKTQLSLKQWTWQWMPRGLNLNDIPVEELRKQGIYLSHASQAVPYWNLSDTKKLQKLLKSRSFKSKVNRYKRRGELQLKKIETTDRFQAILPELAFQTDIRKEATYNARPFADDNNKGAFMLQMMKQSKSHHCTALFLDKKPIAIHFGTEDGTTVHLGTISYDPSESRQSPGTILMILMGELLKEEGFQYLDLTPGTDAYKLRFANEFIDHIRPTFYFSKPKYLKGKMKHWGMTFFKDLVQKYGNPQKFRIKLADLKESLQILKSQPKQWLMTRLNTIQRKSVDAQLLSLDLNAVQSFSMNEMINSQVYQDLFLYPPKQQLSRRSIFSEALSRFQAGDKLFTAQHAGALTAIFWQINFANDKIKALNPQYQNLQKDDIVLRISFWKNDYPFRDFGPLLATILQSISPETAVSIYLEWPRLLGKIPTELESLILTAPNKR